MDAKDHGEQAADNNNICRLEWIAWAIDAARRHKEAEQGQPPPRVRHLKVVDLDDGE